MGKNDQFNEQFNEQYNDVVELVQSRAIWRVGERRTESDQFRLGCLNCGFDSQHRRVDVTSHRLLFGKAIRQIGPANVMVHCQRCGQERHTRDIGELTVPSTVALYESAEQEARSALQNGATTLPASLIAALDAFREEASTPVRKQLVRALATDSPNQQETLAAIGKSLFLSDVTVAEIIEAS